MMKQYLAMMIAGAAGGPPMVPGAATEDELTVAPWMAFVDEGQEVDLSLPARFDWREQPGAAVMTPITPQGLCGSCVSFAITSALEAQLNIACGPGERSFDLSRQYLFSCGGGTCRAGWKLSSAMEFLASHGTPDTSCLPYAGEGGLDVACSESCGNASERLVRPVSFVRPTTGIIDVLAIKRALTKGPLVANMILFEDLESHQSGVYRHTTGRQLGSHAIVFVGWDDQNRSWIARNSWGEDWADGGYFEVARDDASLPGRYTWLLDVTQAKASGACEKPF